MRWLNEKKNNNKEEKDNKAKSEHTLPYLWQNEDLLLRASDMRTQHWIHENVLEQNWLISVPIQSPD